MHTRNSAASAALAQPTAAPLLPPTAGISMRLSLASARSLLLAAQGLLASPAEPARKEDVLAAIRRMGLLQIDTISVVARSPYLVLWSRLGAYEPRWLDELLAEGALFEYWSRNACFLPIEEYPLYRCRMLERGGAAAFLGGAAAFLNDGSPERREAIDRVLSRIRERGLVGLEAGEAGAGASVQRRRADDRPAGRVPAGV